MSVIQSSDLRHTCMGEREGRKVGERRGGGGERDVSKSLYMCVLLLQLLYTVKRLITDPPKSGQPPYSGWFTCPRLILP